MRVKFTAAELQDMARALGGGTKVTPATDAVTGQPTDKLVLSEAETSVTAHTHQEADIIRRPEAGR